jgi:hypothetical protein
MLSSQFTCQLRAATNVHQALIAPEVHPSQFLVLKELTEVLRRLRNYQIAYNVLKMPTVIKLVQLPASSAEEALLETPRTISKTVSALVNSASGGHQTTSACASQVSRSPSFPPSRVRPQLTPRTVSLEFRKSASLERIMIQALSPASPTLSVKSQTFAMDKEALRVTIVLKQRSVFVRM